MSYDNKLLSVLFGTYRLRVLELLLLQPAQRFHVRELARQTGTTAGTLHRELSKLAEAGLLLREKQGNQVLYQANRACPVFAELAGVFRKTSGAVSVVLSALGGIASQIQFALLFGSFAQGTETAGSDVDVLIVGEASFAEVVRALYSAQEKLQREINPVVYSPAEFQLRLHNQEPLVMDVLAKPKLYLIGTEHDFAEFTGHP
ncbi:nucleotidyltransferase domain-containing protein [Ferriphaselus sp. R-1]|uniref:nucleotidyltransferase domain-containing protein n=1 Tax=Ferriphaselus sp. R-1 TaxID=1485544 RepID=UPI000552632E|nr:nucleotidyltransferase domain-containing protein [Ferriphaselus sp. R-1]